MREQPMKLQTPRISDERQLNNVDIVSIICVITMNRGD